MIEKLEAMREDFLKEACETGDDFEFMELIDRAVECQRGIDWIRERCLTARTAGG